MKDINITNHGFDRILERTHCKRGNMKDHILKVWESGKRIEDYSVNSKMSKYLKNVCRVGGEDRAVRVKGNSLYLFNRSGSSFITCYQIPEKILQEKSKKNFGKVY